MDIRISFARHSPCNPPVQSGLLYHYKGFVVRVQASCSASTRDFVLRHALSSRPLHSVGVHKKHNEVVLTFNTPVN